jgi:hypothetical protein
LKHVSDDGRSVTLADPEDPEATPVTLYFQGAPDAATRSSGANRTSGLFSAGAAPAEGGR